MSPRTKSATTSWPTRTAHLWHSGRRRASRHHPEVLFGARRSYTTISTSSVIHANIGNAATTSSSGASGTSAVSSAVAGTPMALRMDEVFVANRPLCIDTAGDPRIRGIRPAAFADISDIVRRVFFPEMPAPLALPSTAWRGVSPAEQHRRLRRAKLFVVSEGAGAVRQLVARPNTTWVIVYDHWFSTNAHFWRHPAYHIHVARSLGARGVERGRDEGRAPPDAQHVVLQHPGELWVADRLHAVNTPE